MFQSRSHVAVLSQRKTLSSLLQHRRLYGVTLNTQNRKIMEPCTRHQLCCFSSRTVPKSVDQSSLKKTSFVMEGHSLADDILDEIKYRSKLVKQTVGRLPRLAILCVGDRADSHKYIRVKQKTANAVDIHTVVEHLPKHSTIDEVIEKINALNIDSGIDGIIIQLPLPVHINAHIALQAVTPSKDVDGFHLHNQANLLDSDYVNTCAFTFSSSQANSPNSLRQQNDAILDIAPLDAATQLLGIEKLNSDQCSDTEIEFSEPPTERSIERLNWAHQRPGSSTEYPINCGSSFPTINSNLAMSFKGATKFLVGQEVRDFTPSGQASPLFPCTPLACIALLDHYNVTLPGAHVVVLGRSTVVGFPLSMMLMHRGAVVSNLDSHATYETMRLLCQNADVIVTAVGKAGLVTPDLIKPGAVILDVGINFVTESSLTDAVPKDPTPSHVTIGNSPISNPIGSSFPANFIPMRRYDCVDKQTPTQSDADETKTLRKLVGDVAFNDCFATAGKITPVPGGIGPVTVAMLLRNVISACEHSASSSSSSRING